MLRDSRRAPVNAGTAAVAGFVAPSRGRAVAGPAPLSFRASFPDAGVCTEQKGFVPPQLCCLLPRGSVHARPDLLSEKDF